MRRRTMIKAGAALGLATLLRIPAHAAGPTVKLRVAEANHTIFYTPMYVAIGKGFASEQGLDVEIISANGGDRAGALLLSGGADIALAGPEVPMYIYNGESLDKPSTFCALTGTDGFYFTSRQKIDKFDWSMVNGKKILGFRPGSTPQLYLEYVLKSKGVHSDTIKSVITNIAPPARAGAWLSGAADFGTFLDPELTTLEKAGQAYEIASIGKEVGRADYTAFFAVKSWLAKNADVAQRWTNAINNAQSWTKTASSADIAAAITTFFPGLAVSEAIIGLDRIRNSGAPIWADSPLVSSAGFNKLKEIMIIGGTLTADKSPPYAAVVDTSFAEAAVKKGG